jgi:hypothetical protein
MLFVLAPLSGTEDLSSLGYLLKPIYQPAKSVRYTNYIPTESG